VIKIKRMRLLPARPEKRNLAVSCALRPALRECGADPLPAARGLREQGAPAAEGSASNGIPVP